MTKRRGVALLTVVLVAALVMVAIVVTSVGVTAEKAITTSEWGFKKALSVAETALTVTEADLRSATWTSTGGWKIDTGHPYLTSDDIATISTAAEGAIVNLGPSGGFQTFLSDNRSRYSVKAKMLTAGTATGKVKLSLYALGEVYGDVAGSTSTLLGRRILHTEATVTFTSEMQSQTAAFKYGLFAKDAIAFGNSENAVIVHGDIYARGNIDLAGKDRLDDLHAVYSLSTVTGVAMSTGKPPRVATDTVIDSNSPLNADGTPAVPDIPFPVLNVAFYHQMAHDFKTGSNWYSGQGIGTPDPHTGLYVNSMYPNTNTDELRNYIQRYLGGADVPATLEGIQNLYLDLAKDANAGGTWVGWMNDDQRHTLLSGLEYAVYHVVTDGTITSFEARGAVMITGPLVDGLWTTTTLHLSGTSSLQGGGGLALLVNGNVECSGGGNESANVSGLLYMTGTFDSGSGHFTVNGSVASGASMDALKGNLTVNYVPINDMPNMSIVGPLGTTTTLERTPGKWIEKDLSRFEHPELDTAS